MELGQRYTAFPRARRRKTVFFLAGRFAGCGANFGAAEAPSVIYDGSFTPATARPNFASAASGTPSNETLPFRSCTRTFPSDAIAASAFSMPVRAADRGFFREDDVSLLVAAVISATDAAAMDFVPSATGTRSLSNAIGSGGCSSGCGRARS